VSSETRDHEQPSTGQRSTRGKTFDVRARPGQEPGTDPADGTGAPESTQLSRSRPRRERRPGTSDLGTRARESLCHVHSRARVSARAPILMCALRPIAPQAVGCRRPLRPLRSSWLLRCERPFCCSPDGVVHRGSCCSGSRGSPASHRVTARSCHPPCDSRCGGASVAMTTWLAPRRYGAVQAPSDAACHAHAQALHAWPLALTSTRPHPPEYPVGSH